METSSRVTILDRLARFNEREYRVPSQVPLASLLGLLTLMALVMASLQWLSPQYRWQTTGYLITLVGAIVLGQLWLNRSPRWASMLLGTLVLMAWVIGCQWLGQPFWTILTLTSVRAFFCLIGLGAFFGYVLGTLIAGIFLVIDVFSGVVRDRAANA